MTAPRRSITTGLRRAIGRGMGRTAMCFPPYGAEIAHSIELSADDTRYAHVALALRRIEADEVPGDLAEVGVYRGDLSAFITAVAPGRLLHLFDTFAGFPGQDLEVSQRSDTRFRDTSVAAVRARLGSARVAFHPGRFPATAADVASTAFALVMLDLDLHAPTLAGLEFFHSRLSPGGFLFVHDYNSPESNHACRRAVDAFLRDKPERPIELPDRWGSIVYRKT